MDGVKVVEKKTNLLSIAIYGIPYGTDFTSPDWSEALAAAGVRNPKRVTKTQDHKETSVVYAQVETPDQLARLKQNRLTVVYTKFRVSDWRPSAKPLQCYNCQELGHAAAACTNGRKCLVCAQDHKHQECPNSNKKEMHKCVNCGGNHTSCFKDCPKLIVDSRQNNQKRSNQSGSNLYAAKVTNEQNNLASSFISSTNSRIEAQLEKLETLHNSVNYLLEALTKFFEMFSCMAHSGAVSINPALVPKVAATSQKNKYKNGDVADNAENATASHIESDKSNKNKKNAASNNNDVNNDSANKISQNPSKTKP
jgi:hypothetical protein